MIINDLYIASYGTLSDKKLTFTDSINIIEGENESGKSTLMAFILFMLYGGSDDVERIKASSNACGGTLTVTTEKHGCVHIERKASVNGKKYTDEVKVHLLPSMKELQIKNSVGEYLLGVNKQFFQATAFISQKGASDYSQKNVNDSIQNILLSASESYNTDKALKKLDDVRKFFALKRGRGGVISELEDKISSLKYALDANAEKINVIKERTIELEELKLKKAKYESLISDIFTEKQARSQKEVSDAKLALDEKEELLRIKNSELSAVSSECDRFIDRNSRARIRELDVKLKYNEARIAELSDFIENNNAPAIPDASSCSDDLCSSIISEINKKRASAKSLYSSSVFAFSLSAIAMISTILLILRELTVPSVILSAVFVVFACAGFVLLSKKKSTIQSLANTLRKYSYPPDISISEIKNDFASKQQDLKEAERLSSLHKEKSNLLKIATAERDTTITEINTELSLVLGKTVKFSTDADLQNAEEYINNCFIKLESLKKDVSSLNAEIANLTNIISKKKCDTPTDKLPDSRFAEYTDNDLDSVFKKSSVEVSDLVKNISSMEKEIAVLQTSAKPKESFENEINKTNSKLALRREQLDIVRLSEESVRFASENIRSAVTPQLIAKGDSLFSTITDQKYSGIGVTDDLCPNTLRGNSIKKSTELSYGTNEAMYLAFRSALLLTLCKNELPPLMLDETFAHIDNKRTLECIKLISSSKMQSLILTCSDRERRILCDDSLVYNVVTL